MEEKPNETEASEGEDSNTEQRGSKLDDTFIYAFDDVRFFFS